MILRRLISDTMVEQSVTIRQAASSTTRHGSNQVARGDPAVSKFLSRDIHANSNIILSMAFIPAGRALASFIYQYMDIFYHDPHRNAAGRPIISALHDDYGAYGECG